MPVEIKELVIRTVVDYSPTSPESSSPELSGGREASDDQNAIVQACVKQVLKILKRQQKR